MAVTASQLRQDIYRLLDHVLETGEPLAITRRGRTLLVTTDQPVSRLTTIRGNPDAIVGDPEELVEIDWTDYWDADGAISP